MWSDFKKFLDNVVKEFMALVDARKRQLNQRELAMKIIRLYKTQYKIKRILSRLDNSDIAAVCEMTGLSEEAIKELGGINA